MCEKIHYTSHRIKDMILLDYLEGLDIEETILFTDAFDAYFLADENEILEKYHQFNIPIVFSGEIACWPESALSLEYPLISKDNHFRYLNSGGFIGRCGDFINLIKKYYFGDRIELRKHLWSNQYVWNQIYLNEKSVIKIDSSSEIFYTLCSQIDVSKSYVNDYTTKVLILDGERTRLSNEMQFDNGRFKSSITNSFPCHLHFNSPAVKDLMKTDFFIELEVWR